MTGKANQGDRSGADPEQPGGGGKRRRECQRPALAKRDPDDAHPLALAMALELPLWSNDKDLDGQGAVRLTTAKLLAILDRPPAKP